MSIKRLRLCEVLQGLPQLAIDLGRVAADIGSTDRASVRCVVPRTGIIGLYFLPQQNLYLRPLLQGQGA